MGDLTKHIVFDADDTLWDEQGLLQTFENAIEATLDREIGAKTEFSKDFIELENRNIPHIGYGFPSYMFSFAEALSANATWYAQKDKVLDRISQFMRDFNLKGPRIIAGVPEALRSIKEMGYDISVLTRGVEFEQRFKLQRSGLTELFSNVLVVDKKVKDTYITVSARLSVDIERLCMVGNSIRSDVNPAAEAGWRAVHVPAPSAWAHDEGEVINSPRVHRVEKISELPSLISAKEFWTKG